MRNCPRSKIISRLAQTASLFRRIHVTVAAQNVAAAWRDRALTFFVITLTCVRRRVVRIRESITLILGQSFFILGQSRWLSVLITPPLK